MSKIDTVLPPIHATVDSATSGALPKASSGLPSSKIDNRHLERLAFVYVRQSQPQQVVNHRESRELQYALADRAVALGWPRERVIVIDDDQGTTATAAEHRDGFHQLMAEVAMDHVGIILGIDMSRLARCNKDWHQLLEMCGLIGTVLADYDAVFDPNDSNDRLVLGLKGTISEFELVTMRNRLHRAKLNKAKRGELYLSVPTGFVKLSASEAAMDPDEQVQAVIRMVFDKFDELGSGYRVFRYLVRHGIRLGMRVPGGPLPGKLEWRPPSTTTLYTILHHPMFAGAYVYGRTQVDCRKPRNKRGGKQRKQIPREQWEVFLPDRVTGYITWERYLRNQERLRGNRSCFTARGTARKGQALLHGLVTCGQCGSRMYVWYSHTQRPRYWCSHGLRQGLVSTCQGVQTKAVDAVVVQQVLRALEPAGLEMSAHATEDIERDRQKLLQHWQHRLERARYETNRAARQYEAVEPENRLVARTLEKRWEEALRNQRQLEEEFDRHRQTEPPQLSQAERAQLQELAADLPRLWTAEGTTAEDRKDLIRAVVEKVVVMPQQTTEFVDITIHWHGGFVSQHAARRSVLRTSQLRDYDQLVERIREFHEKGLTAREIAERLNAEGFQPAYGKGGFTKGIVGSLLNRLGACRPRKHREKLRPHEWWPRDLAEALRISEVQLRSWISRGWLHARALPWNGTRIRLWVAWADGDELRRLRRLRASRSGRQFEISPPELTTPKTPPEYWSKPGRILGRRKPSKS
jgi:DNA invertase Pin-like site-specific DNA recombinase